MAEDFPLIETTNERGFVEQTRVSVNEIVLDLSDRSLVRIVGLERATTLQQLDIHRPINAFWWNLTDSRSFRSARWQLLRRRACVCARIDAAQRSHRECRFSSLFVSSLSLLTPL
jgi:hypothetical protein